jgi:heme oxygenase
MAELLAGRVGLPAYTQLLRNLHALYAALEAALRASADAALLPLPALRREAALAADLDLLQGPRWHDELPLHEATRAYVQRLQAQAHEQPRLLMAHAYLRYLGDLHGGQMLQRLVARALGGQPALSFYDFGPPEQVLALRAQVRDALARLPVQDEAEATRLVDEARWGFTQHQRLFEGLAAA